MDTYILRPRADGQGWSLTGPGLAYPLWLRDELDGARRALAGCRRNGGRLIVQRGDGSTEIVEHYDADPGFREDGFGA